jgi:hypothetical protein
LPWNGDPAWKHQVLHKALRNSRTEQLSKKSGQLVIKNLGDLQAGTGAGAGAGAGAGVFLAVMVLL